MHQPEQFGRFRATAAGSRPQAIGCHHEYGATRGD